MLLTGATFRKAAPVLAVTGVFAVALLAPVPSLASSINNCGVKGYGYHDHGKVCPNRPFPGHGVGLAKFGLSFEAKKGGGALTGHAKVTALNTADKETKGTKKSATSVATKNRGKSGSHRRSHRAIALETGPLGD